MVGLLHDRPPAQSPARRGVRSHDRRRARRRRAARSARSWSRARARRRCCCRPTCAIRRWPTTSCRDRSSLRSWRARCSRRRSSRATPTGSCSCPKRSARSRTSRGFGERLRERLAAGYVITCVGNPHPFVYKRSRRGDTLADRAARHVLGMLRPELGGDRLLPRRLGRAPVLLAGLQPAGRAAQARNAPRRSPSTTRRWTISRPSPRRRWGRPTPSTPGS